MSTSKKRIVMPTQTAPVSNECFVAQRVGTSVFCAIEGRLVCLHLKTDHTFLITVTQEPLLVYLGTFRFTSLMGNRGGAGGSESAVTYARAMIEAFERTASKQGDEGSGPTSASSYGPTIGTNHQATMDIGVRLILDADIASSERSGSVLHNAAFSEPGSPVHGESQEATLARRSSLIALHRSKMDIEMSPVKKLAPVKIPTANNNGGDALAVSTPQSPLHRLMHGFQDERNGSAFDVVDMRPEEVRQEAGTSRGMALLVRFDVHGTRHSVLMHLRPCPPEPNIREHVVWGLFMDLYRTVDQQRHELLRLDERVRRHEIDRAARLAKDQASARQAMISSAQKNGSVSFATPHPHHQTTTSASTSRCGSAKSQRPNSGSTRRFDVPFAELQFPPVQPHLGTFHPTHIPLAQHGSRPPPVGSGGGGASPLDGQSGASSRHQESASSPTTAAAGVLRGSPRHDADKQPTLDLGALSDAAQQQRPLKRSPDRQTAPQRNNTLVSQPQTAQSWSYSPRCTYLESSKGTSPRKEVAPLRPTSGSTDFQFRTQYVRDVFARTLSDGDDAVRANGSGGEPLVDQFKLLHPTAPPSAATIRGTFASRTTKPISTVQLTL